MPQLSYDILFCSTFVIILVAMLRIRRTVFAEETDAFRKMTTGILFLLGFSLIQLAGHQNMFAGIGYLEMTAGRKVVEAVSIAAGLIFLLSGIGSWLPSMARGRGEKGVVNRRYSCLKIISQTVARGKNLDDIMDTTLQCLNMFIDVPRCAAYKYSSRQKTMHRAGTVGFSDNTPPPPEVYNVKNSKLLSLLQKTLPIVGAPDDPELAPLAQPAMMVPIIGGNKLYGALLCWRNQGVAFDDDFIDFMTVIGEIIGRQVQSHVIDVKCTYHRTQQEAYEQLTEVSNRIATVGDLIRPFFRMMKTMVGAEFMSLASLDGSGENMMRYAIGSSGRMLLEKGVSRQTRGTDVYTVYQNGEPLLEPEITDAGENTGQDGLFLSCGMRSKLVFPVKVGNRVVAVITLGHTQVGHFSRYHLHRISRFPDIIAAVIHREQMNRKLETKEDLMLRLQLMQRHLLDKTPVQAFFDDACEMLTRRMECTFARISLINKQQTDLVSQACRTIRDTGNDLRYNESVPLSLLPWHRMTLDAQKLMLINQDDPESRMQAQESSSALIPGIKSAILVPIMLGDEVRGVISIGESRNWKRRSFGATDLIFAKDVAAKCSMALRMKQMEIDVENSRDEINRILLTDTIEGDGQWRNQIKSPLTSIIGAIELLRAKGESNQFSSHYHDLILKSANRIKTMAEEDSPRDTLTLVKAEPEQVIG